MQSIYKLARILFVSNSSHVSILYFKSAVKNVEYLN